MPNPLPIVVALVLVGQTDAPPTRPAVTPDQIVSALETVLADAIAQAEPSVVAIHRDKAEGSGDITTAVRGRTAPADDGRLINNDVDPFASDLISLDDGSGVVIGENGEILTAYHVVKGARRLLVRAMKQPMFLADVIAADPRSDLAVIAPRTSPDSPPIRLKPMPLGDATKLRKGHFIIALGNSFNAARHDGRPSAGWGILSNVARRLDISPEEEDRGDVQLRHLPTLLQLDAKLNLGMSGGAVINLKGELVGITTVAANASGQDIHAGYAIPVDLLGRNVINTLRQGKEYEYGFLGIILDRERGTNKVTSASEGTPAAEGGVRVDDRIVAVGEIPVTDADSLVVAINSMPAGETVKLKVERGKVSLERDVHLAKRKVNGEVISTNRPESWRGLRVDYTSTMASNAIAHDVAEALARRGVLVTQVENGSKAISAGIKVGQIISRVNGQPVPNPREFAKVVQGLKGPVKVETEQGTVTIE